MNGSDRLYHLPEHPASASAFAVRCLSGVAVVSLLTAWILGQRFAHRLGYPPLLGTPSLAWNGAAAPWLRGAALALSAIALLDLILAIRSRHLRATPLVFLAVAALADAAASGPLYGPIDALSWWLHYRHFQSVGPLLAASLRLWLLVVGSAMGSAVALFLSRLSDLLRRPDVHGSAAWASASEVRDTRMLAPHYFDKPTPGDHAVFLGLWPQGRRLVPLVDREPRHVFVFAPTRSGKGVGLVVPNLLSWQGAALIHDIKGENWALTAGWRARELGSRCLRFDPTDTTGTTARFNPLLEIRPGENDVRDAQNIAEILLDPNGDEKATHTHWDRTARALLTAAILHVLYHPGHRKTLAAVAELFAPPVEAGDTTTHPSHELLDAPLLEMMHFRHLPDGPHPTISSLAKEVYLKPKEEKGSVISTALAYLALYRDPILARNLAASDFRPADLMHAERPVSLYLTVPPTDLARTRPIIRLLLHQFLSRLVEQLDFADGKPVVHFKQPLLLMLDEFPALGKLAFFQQSLAYVAGYGLRAFLITQDLSQHHAIYGKDESITANCDLRIAFGPNKVETAELLSKMTGDATVHQRKRSLNLGGGKGLFGDRRVSYSQTETRRPLLTPEEVLRLPATDELLFRANTRPIYCQRARFYADPELARRAAIPPPPTSRPDEALPTPWCFDPTARPSGTTAASGGSSRPESIAKSSRPQRPPDSDEGEIPPSIS